MADRDESQAGRSATGRIVWWLFVIGLSFVAVIPLIPPLPASVDADPSGFSASRALEHVSAIARNPHPLGSTESVAVRGYIAATLKEVGWTVDLQSFVADDYFGEPGGSVEGVNVVARRDGSNASGAILLVAHYDTHPASPGANDNSVPVAALLEAARALSNQPALRNDVLVLFTDGEEPAPRYGARAFINGHPWFNDVSLVVNLEASGSTGPSLLAETSGSEGWLLGGAADASGNGTAYSFVTSISDAIGGFGTDFTPFKERGIPGLSFAYSHGSPIYHTEFDNVSNVGMRSMQHHGNRTLGLVRYFGGLPLDVVSDSQTWTYFTVIDHRTVRYPNHLALPIASLAVAGLMLLIGRSIRTGETPLLLKGVASTAVWILAVIIVSDVVWFGTARLRPFVGVWESYAWLIGLSGAAFLAGRRSLGRVRQSDFITGLIAVGVGLALGTAIVAPGASYLFAIPSLACCLLAIERASQSNHPVIVSRLTGAIVVGATILLAVPAIDVFWQLSQPRTGNQDSELLPVAGIAIAMAAAAALIVVWASPRNRNGTRTLMVLTQAVGAKPSERSLAAGVQPYDALNGARIGAFSGGVLGAVPSLVFGTGVSWLIVIGAVAGGVLGYVYVRRGTQ